MSTSIPVNKVRIDGGTQVRQAIKEDAVARYAETIESLPPIDVFFDGTDYWLADGFHRYHAHQRAGKGDIRCNVHKGNRRAAQLHAIGANSEHGEPRTIEDRRNAVTALLDDPEWSKQS